MSLYGPTLSLYERHPLVIALSDGVPFDAVNSSDTSDADDYSLTLWHNGISVATCPLTPHGAILEGTLILSSQALSDAIDANHGYRVVATMEVWDNDADVKYGSGNVYIFPSLATPFSSSSSSLSIYSTSSGSSMSSMSSVSSQSSGSSQSSSQSSQSARGIGVMAIGSTFIVG